MLTRTLWLRLVFLIFIFSSLFACGGGGGGSNSSDQQQTGNGNGGGTETNPATLTVGTPANATISGITSSYFTFKTGSSAGSYGISITGAQSDLSWDLFSDPGYSAFFVASCDKLFGAGNEICSTTLSANTTYYLRVNSWDNTSTNYTLTITFLDPAAGCGSGTCFNFENGSMPASFVYSGNASWVIDNANAVTGTYSIHSGAITDNQTSCFEYTPAGSSGVVLFSLKTDSEQWVDLLKFYIDGTLQSSTWSGNTAWTRVIFGTSTGTHTYKWCYSKDGSYSIGADRVWLDDIEFK